jgi:hypothetical protein
MGSQRVAGIKALILIFVQNIAVDDGFYSVLTVYSYLMTITVFSCHLNNPNEP